MSTPLMAQLKETSAFIQSKIKSTAQTAIILGSGLGNLATQIQVDFEIQYTQIPHFPISTVEGHKGRLILGSLNGVKVWVMEGRFHFYEGYSPEQVAYPVRVLKLLGVENLILSNAAGGVNPNFEVGDLMIIKDHISLFSINPLIGKKVSNVRSVTADEALVIVPPIRTTLEYSLQFINDDELVEVTPKSIRIRKRFLLEHERKRAQKS